MNNWCPSVFVDDNTFVCVSSTVYAAIDSRFCESDFLFLRGHVAFSFRPRAPSDHVYPVTTCATYGSF